MRLRPRLALTLIAVSLPLVIGLVLLDARSKQRAAEDELTELTQALAATPDWRERCEAQPESWRGAPPLRGSEGPPPEPPTGAPPPGGPAFHPFPHRRPATFFAYDTKLTSSNPDAPTLSPSLRARLQDHESTPLSLGLESSTVRVLVRVAGDGNRCAFVLAEGTTEPWLGGFLPATEIWLLPLLAVIAAVWIAVGPVVRRIRHLTAAAQESVESEYTSGVVVGGDDEITELARSFDGAAKRVRAELAESHRKEQALREFLANTTHDIMIPLTVLQGHLADSKQRAARGEPLDGETLRAAMDEAHYLGALIHNLTIAAKLEAGRPELQLAPVDLGALVERVASRHRPIARGSNVSLDSAVPSSPLIITGDLTLLEQAVSNLVYNAIRYNRAGGHVATILESDGPEAFVLRVIDDGPGIAEAELARLVERGFRGNDARTRAPEGHGLGLHITQRVADLHQLRLSFGRSEYGGLQVDLCGAGTTAR